MPKTAPGVYRDKNGGWYYKAEIGRDPLTGKPIQLTRRGFATAGEAASARREQLAKIESGAVRASRPTPMTVAELMGLFLDGLDADRARSVKTRLPHLGKRKVREVTPEMLPARQRKLAASGGTKTGKPLAPNTVRLARAPLAGAFKLALDLGVIGVNPTAATPRISNSASRFRSIGRRRKRGTSSP